jgi:acetyl esterase/lipase
MTFIALILLLMALSALLTYRPHNPVVVMLYWLSAWLGQIFAPQWALLCLLLALWHWSSDWNSRAQELVTLGVLLLANGLFARVHRLGTQTTVSLNPVITEAAIKLGEDSAEPGPGKNAAVKTHALEGIRVFNFKRAGVVRLKNISYGAAGRENCLDIYQPAIKPALPMPVLLHIPGGAWVTGSKDQQGLPLLYHMAAQNWTCISINYRLGPNARFPAMLEDVLRAIAWVKSHAGEYGANPEFVAVTGGSAGGHLLSLAALLREREQFQPGFEQIDTRVSVAVPIYGRYDFLNRHGLLPGEGLKPFLSEKVMPGPPASCPGLWDLASPESQVHADAPPFLVIHGSADSMIPVEEARQFVTALRQVSHNPVDYAELPGAQHAYDMLCSSWAMPTVYAVSRYLEAHYGAHLRSD